MASSVEVDPAATAAAGAGDSSISAVSSSGMPAAVKEAKYNEVLKASKKFFGKYDVDNVGKMSTLKYVVTIRNTEKSCEKDVPRTVFLLIPLVFLCLFVHGTCAAPPPSLPLMFGISFESMSKMPVAVVVPAGFRHAVRRGRHHDCPFSSSHLLYSYGSGF